MRFKFENLKNYALLYIATCAFALLGSPLYCRADFIMQHYENLSLDLLADYDTDGNFHVERFEDIKGYEGQYQISTFGRVKSTNNYHKKPERILKGRIKKNGYVHVNLRINAEAKTVLVHRLLAVAFIHNPENKKEVNHKDLIKYNNVVWNLEWNTPKENQCHRRLHENNSSKYRGVTWQQKNKKWIAAIYYGKQRVHIGLFNDEYAAHLAYEKEANKKMT